MTDKPVSPLRQRMIGDMTVRHFKGIHPLCTPGKGRSFLKARYAAFAWVWCCSFQFQGNNSLIRFAG